jgi:hypothetical protein
MGAYCIRLSTKRSLTYWFTRKKNLYIHSEKCIFEAKFHSEKCIVY